MLSFAACHSGGNNNPIATTNPEPTTNPTTTNPPNPTPALLPILTGVFVDAPWKG